MKNIAHDKGLCALVKRCNQNQNQNDRTGCCYVCHRNRCDLYVHKDIHASGSCQRYW